MFLNHHGGLCICQKMAHLFEAFRNVCSLNDWCLFIDNLSWNLKVVLPHNENKHPFPPLAHSVYHEEDYNSKVIAGYFEA